jgi:hypothetical protein
MMIEHTASRMNPPAEALAQAGRESRRAEEREYGLRVPTEDEVDCFAGAIGVDGRAAVIALTVSMAEGALGTLGSEEIANLARNIQRYGDERAESAIERYQEQGE